MSTVKRQLMDALSLSQFLIDAGWYVSAVKVLRVVENACQHLSAAAAAACNQDNTFLALIQSDTQLKLLHGYSASCSFPEADALYERLASCAGAGGLEDCRQNDNMTTARYQELAAMAAGAKASGNCAELFSIIKEI